ncbi:prepilin peptidase [Planctomycetota bacterium]
MWISTLSENNVPVVQWTVVIACAFAAATTDILTRRIPNRLCGPVLLLGLVWAALVAGLSGLADAALGSLIAMAPFVLLFIFAGGGAGDAKIMGALGAWLGVRYGVVALLCVAVSGGALGLAFAVARRRLGGVFRNFWLLLQRVLLHIAMRTFRGLSLELPEDPKMIRMPYGPAIFVGVCVAAIGVHLCGWGALLS